MPDRETMPPAGAPGVTAPAAALPQEALRIASGYAFTGPALHLGALLWDGQASRSGRRSPASARCCCPRCCG